jgi:UDP-N-acetylmuramoyl-L-alanyl-D-glutamate--2,6-diaminopimelate ligase
VSKTLSELLQGLKVIESIGSMNKEVTKVCFDSRQAAPGSLFVAVRGTQVDGHEYIEKATSTGAIVIVCEVLPTTKVEGVSYVGVEDCSVAIAVIAANFYDNPSRQFKLVGVTGTNGKTTTATLLFDLFKGMGYRSGLISTVENRIDGRVIPSTHTTPDPIALNALFADMVNEKVDYVFMEVSSHAIHQNRIAGLHFAGGIFSNITHDHLDYHKTFDEYIKAKKKFFDGLPKGSFALTNVDDKVGNVMVQNTKATIHRYGLKKNAEFKAKILANSITGLQLQLDGFEYHGRLIGEFNAYNTLAAYSTGVLLGIDKIEILTVLSQLKGAEGRFDYTYLPDKDLTGIVDYAHTPDALEKVLQTIQQLRKKAGERVICVTGCGGDRDPMKRKIMGQVAATLSDIVIITSDNPRTEDPDHIIRQIEEGVPEEFNHKVLSITNRHQAIKTAIKMAQRGDIILLAGKGHEKYQDIMGVKQPFDDKKELEIGFGIVTNK